jgi:DNA-binding YbaB/EbfC family protein
LSNCDTGKAAEFSITKLLNYKISMGGFNLQDLMSKAKSQYDSLQKKMQETVVDATSGGGAVAVKMDGRKQLLSLRINPEAVKSGDVEMLQDLILAAVNEAARKVDAQMQSTVGGMLGGLGIPGL